MHGRAVIGTLLVSLVWGASFAAMKFALQSGLSVGTMLSLRFTLGALCLGLIAWFQGVRPGRRELLDGFWLGLLLALIIWLQADGLRFTSVSKSGFITGLYVLFTPMVSLAIGQRLRLSHGLGAILAVVGLYLLVHDPAQPMGGWNRGDFETLLCAMACGGQIVLTGRYSRRGNPWSLAFVQVLVAALLSLAITACLPGRYGFVLAPLAIPGVWIALAYQAVLATALAFFLMMLFQAHLGATEAAIIYSAEPVFSALLAMSGWVPGIKDALGPLQLLGGAIILGSMLLAELGPRFLKWRMEQAEDVIG
ncbi:MAG: family transporter [Holophagaceae bacterium]|nr:family transporter [Holophagaceae bacterium]